MDHDGSQVELAALWLTHSSPVLSKWSVLKPFLLYVNRISYGRTMFWLQKAVWKLVSYSHEKVILLYFSANIFRLNIVFMGLPTPLLRIRIQQTPKAFWVWHLSALAQSHWKPWLDSVRGLNVYNVYIHGMGVQCRRLCTSGFDQTRNSWPCSTKRLLYLNWCVYIFVCNMFQSFTNFEMGELTWMMSSRSGRFGCGSDGPDCPPGWGLHEDQTVPLASLLKTPDVGYCSFRMRIRVGSPLAVSEHFSWCLCILDLQRYNMLDHGWSNVRCADDGMCFILSDFHVNDIDMFLSSAGRMGVEHMMLQGVLPIKTILGLWCFCHRHSTGPDTHCYKCFALKSWKTVRCWSHCLLSKCWRSDEFIRNNEKAPYFNTSGCSESQLSVVHSQSHSMV